MPGGPKEAYESVRAIFEAIAAKVDGEPCVSYLGVGAAGHYVKMVHNGIEYGFMQLIADSYALMRQALGLSNDELAAVYAGWDEAELDSYLVEITAQIFRRRDDKTGGYLVDLILGEAGQLGTGMWASQSAMSLQMPVPNIDIAVAMRNLSALEEERHEARTLLGPADSAEKTAARVSPGGEGPVGMRSLKSENVRGALYAAMVITYAQGFAQLQAASKAMGWTLQAGRRGFDLAGRLHSEGGPAAGHQGGIPAVGRNCRTSFSTPTSLESCALQAGRSGLCHRCRDVGRCPRPGPDDCAGLSGQLSSTSGCRPTSSRPNATTSARIPTGASTRAGYFTPTGRRAENDGRWRALCRTR